MSRLFSFCFIVLSVLSAGNAFDDAVFIDFEIQAVGHAVGCDGIVREDDAHGGGDFQFLDFRVRLADKAVRDCAGSGLFVARAAFGFDDIGEALGRAGARGGAASQQEA